MFKINWTRPPKSMTETERRRRYQSDTNIAGTYAVNMEKEDAHTWWGKIIKRGDDPRVELRKSFPPQSARMLLVMRPNGVVTLSLNGKVEVGLIDLQAALDVALEAAARFCKKPD